MNNYLVGVRINYKLILLIGVFLVLELLYIERSMSSRFELSMITLDSLLPSKNIDR